MPATAKIIEPRWTRRREDRPQELIDAALTLFVDGGYAATRLEDIAKRAGVSKGTLYLYFDTKEALFKAVIHDGIVEKFVEAEAEIGQFTGSSADLLRQLIRLWWQEIGSTKLAGISKLMTAEARNFPELASYYHVEVIERGYHLFDMVIWRGINSGEFRQVDMKHFSRLCAAPLLMLSIWRHSFSGRGSHTATDPTAYIEAHIDMLLSALRIAKQP